MSSTAFITQVHAEFDTPLGPMRATADGSGIRLLTFSEHQPQPDPRFPADVTASSPAERHLLLLRQQLLEYFARTRQVFEVPLAPEGTPFQQTVWAALQRIPYGATRTYMQQAKAMQSPEAIRAVAAANGANPIAILVPCHRVVGAHGELTGYAGGLWRKRWLLDFEQGALQLL
jgi:O-6-methylguanine DNA methyltransferase